MLDNNARVVDLSDLAEPFPLDVAKTRQPLLTHTEPWELSILRDLAKDLLRYPSVVRNVHGPNADHRYYLFYAHHDPPSGIGCAVSDEILGPYAKIA